MHVLNLLEFLSFMNSAVFSGNCLSESNGRVFVCNFIICYDVNRTIHLKSRPCVRLLLTLELYTPGKDSQKFSVDCMISITEI